MRDAEERDFLDVDRGLAGVGERGAVEVALADAGELEGGRSARRCGSSGLA